MQTIRKYQVNHFCVTQITISNQLPSAVEIQVGQNNTGHCSIQFKISTQIHIDRFFSEIHWNCSSNLLLRAILEYGAIEPKWLNLVEIRWITVKCKSIGDKGPRASTSFHSLPEMKNLSAGIHASHLLMSKNKYIKNTMCATLIQISSIIHPSLHPFNQI